jgi:selenocysteine-specific translation elongation factor
VSDEKAEKIASENEMKYFKTSAFKGDGIENMIEDVI